MAGVGEPQFEAAMCLRDDEGALLASRTTAAPSAFLVRGAGVHTTDSWDWVRAADEAFADGSPDWVTDPYRGR
jgi:hypothetical protein